MKYSIRHQVGDLEVFILTDGKKDFDQDTFTNTNTSEIKQLLSLNSKTKIETNFNAFLVKSQSKTILIDAGAGKLFGSIAGNLGKALQELNIKNDAITDLIATHLHPDHIGGMLTDDGKMVFKNASLTMSEEEYSFWRSPENFKDQPDQKRLPILLTDVYSDRLKLCKIDADLGSGLSAINLPGHTAGHIGVRVSSGDRQFIIAADIIHAQYLQINNPSIGVVFDQDYELAKNSRVKLLDMLSNDQLEFSGGHLIFPAVGRIATNGTSYQWVQSQIAGNSLAT